MGVSVQMLSLPKTLYGNGRGCSPHSLLAGGFPPGVVALGVPPPLAEDGRHRPDQLVARGWLLSSILTLPRVGIAYVCLCVCVWPLSSLPVLNCPLTAVLLSLPPVPVSVVCPAIRPAPAVRTSSCLCLPAGSPPPGVGGLLLRQRRWRRRGQPLPARPAAPAQFAASSAAAPPPTFLRSSAASVPGRRQGVNLT